MESNKAKLLGFIVLTYWCESGELNYKTWLILVLLGIGNNKAKHLGFIVLTYWCESDEQN